MDGAKIPIPASPARDAIASRMLVHHWWFVLLAVGSAIAWRRWGAPDEAWSQTAAHVQWVVGPFLIASIILLPVIVWDAVRLSRRVVEPAEQVQESMVRFVNAGERRPVAEEPFAWSDLVCSWNRILREDVAETSRPALGSEESIPEANRETGAHGVPAPKQRMAGRADHQNAQSER